MIYLTEALLGGAALLGDEAERAAEYEGKTPGIHGCRRPPNPLGEGPTPPVDPGRETKENENRAARNGRYTSLNWSELIEGSLITPSGGTLI